MTEQANRIDWLERQLAQVRQFIERDKLRLAESPKKFSIQLSLDSWLSHQDELQQDLRQAKAALMHEVVELRLIGRRMDGSIPLRLLTKVAEKFNSAVAHAAYHLRHGSVPKKGIPEGVSEEIDLRLSGLSFGSTRLMFAGNIAPDTVGDSLMEGALEQIFDVLSSPSQERIRELVRAIGAPAARALSDLLAALEKQEIGAELTWPSPNSTVYHWGGSLEAVRSAHSRLHVLQIEKPIAVTVEGRVSQLNETGALYVRDDRDAKTKVHYNKQQYPHIQKLTLGMQVSLQALKHTTRDEVAGREYTTYHLVTED
ncbi:hypothetical protein [Pseudomonas sp. CCOS 191]|uniref:hypothetical protein n=1 Tax=Pseudomonas sp. CCOS 191 TaxID=1649877 RepID=UPI000624D939|nr:hypothetical protein [Pseudomonas sp. CCOS 191]CRI56368.1 hypothetical protein CCOS191_1832 [Pseudomonas sp. CCOS 191]